MPFDRSAAASRLERLWKLSAQFGTEQGANRVYLDEIVSDRLQLVSGLQVLRDELQFAVPPADLDREACTADFTHPTVLTTLAFTNCGDRIHHGEIEQYQQVVAARFATLSEVGTLKPEGFHPTGGGTDDGATLAHVTWAHALDEPLQKRLYEGNPQSFVLCAFDLMTHVGRHDDDGSIAFGKTRESQWREPRAACGAIVGALAAFNEANGVHVRIRRVLGEPSYELLAKKGIKTKEGVDITAVVAAAIVAVKGMQDTAHALTHEMDRRGLAHLTAGTMVNRSSMRDTMIYYARATVFDGEIRTQGFGTDAAKYAGELVEYRGERRLHLTYGGADGTNLPTEKSSYTVQKSVPLDFYA